MVRELPGRGINVLKQKVKGSKETTVNSSQSVKYEWILIRGAELWSANVHCIS